MPLQPTFVGHVDSTQDALILFQAVIDGTLPSVSRRPQDRERSELVKSGSIFIFNEHSSGIKRWTDGIAWSPSRILNNFLVYRQLERPFNSGEKKQTKKRQKRITPYDRVANVGISRSSITNIDIDTNTNTIDNSTNTNIINNTHPGSVTGASLPIQINLPNNSIPTLPINNDRSLVGSLVDSYGFKKDGLIKKTISIVYNGENLHLVSYYKPEDVLAGHFQQPSKSPTLKTISISHDLISRQHFRVPIDPIHSSLASSVGFDNTNVNSNNPKNTFLPHIQSYPEMYDMDNFHQNHLVKQENVYYQQQPLPHSPIETNNSNYYYSNYYIRNPSDVSSASTSIPTTNSITNHTAISTIPTPNPINNPTTTNPMTIPTTTSLYSYQPYLPTISDTYSDPRRLPDMLPPSSLAVLSSASPLQQRQNLNVNYGFGTCANAMW